MSGQRRALLVAGDVKVGFRDRRHFNDLRRWGESLVRRGFECRACVGDGRTGPLTMSVEMHPGRRGDLLDQLAWLAALEGGDTGVLVVANHGVETGIVCFGHGAPVTPADVSAIFAGCAAQVALVLGQCHAGAFAPVAKACPSVAVVAACSAAQRSSESPDKNSNEFLHQLHEAWLAPGARFRSLGAAFSAAAIAVRIPCFQAPHDGCEHAEIHDPRGFTGAFII